GAVELVLTATKAPDYAIVELALDDVSLGAPLDLYAPKVEATGELVLGTRELARGSHVLRARIAGANPRAAQKHFVGLDRLQLRRGGPGYEVEVAAAIESAAASHGVDASRLGRWSRALRSDAARAEGSVLALLARLAAEPDAESRARSWADARRASEEAVRAQETALAQTEVIARFDRDFEGWYETGHAFAGRPALAGDWDPRRGAFGIASAGRADSGRLQPKLQGALRSPTFEITQPRLHWKLAGTGGQVRLIIDSYVMDTYNELIFGDVHFGVDTRGRTIWRNQIGDVGRFLGHRAHLEILDDGDGWIAVDEIRAGAGEIAAAPDASTRAWLAGASELQAIGAALQERVARARIACAEGALDEEAREWLALLGEHGLLELGVDARMALEAEHAAWASEERELPRPEHALAAADGTPEDEYVFLRGSWRNKGPVVPRGFLTALGGDSLCSVPHGSGRLELADAVLSASNPLPARVLVNRAWHHLFGRGLVPTTDDFGVLGEAPTHPELLDHLADWFRVEARWSLKALLRRLVLSSTYRMSSIAADPRAAELDPEAIWLHRARVRRLQGEALRDAMLAVAGRLDPKMYGPPVALHLTAFLEGRGRPGHSGPVDGAGRRTIYQAVRRNFLPPFQMAFDMPVPFSTTGRRSVSNVPAQALALMNDPFVREMAQHWSQRVLALKLADDRARIERMYREAFARAPLAAELEAALAFVAEQRATHGSGADGERETFSDVAHVLFQVKEFQFLD
ncbi:MAG: DUF1553 domain-containing protein, partial [Planctomycetes bacterium]|nr:DUF1553 domain-containing protein [Planctomycetota bacterium]